MSSPEANPTPVTQAPPIPALAPGQRALAAIVFTDTVNFSALMSRDEERALRLVARDLEQMRTVCRDHGGQVLKSTGDGLLMLFTSAVQAVACALEIQREFHRQNLTLPPSEQLRHRIGIHLGDVFQQDGDVMGDGVNIAARLQTEADPGGICISNTVFEVVNNRLPFYVNDLGPRKLKNVGIITAYLISPTDSRPRYLNRILRWWPAGLLVGVGLLILLALLTGTYNLGVTREKTADELRRQAEIEAQQHADNEWRKLAQQLNPAAPGTPAEGDGSKMPPPSGPYPAPGKIAASDAEFEIVRFNYMKKYDFTSMCAWLKKYDCPSADEDKLYPICLAMRDLFDWCQVQLQKYSAEKPLIVHDDKNDKDYQFWPEVSGGVMFKTETGTMMLPHDQIPPLAMAGIAMELIQQNAPPNTPATRLLWRGLKLFIQTYPIKLSKQSQEEIDQQTESALLSPDIRKT